MTPRKDNARPKAMKPSIKSLIAKRAIENPTLDRTILANQIIDEINNMGEIPPTIDTTIHYISDFRGKLTEDKPWNTATLKEEPISYEALPWLMAIQEWRKEYISKPLTIREAKWFNRLFGFKAIFNPFARFPELKTSDNPSLINTWTYNLIATFAQFYARKEKIDTIAGIKEPDYSDLDDNITKGNFQAIFKASEKALYQAMHEIAALPNDTPGMKAKLEKFSHNWLQPATTDNIYYYESAWLTHILGEPDMSLASRGLYVHTLKTISLDPNINEWTLKLPTYDKRMKFFLGIRVWCKNNPDELKKYYTRPETDEDIVKMLKATPVVPEMANEILEIIEKDGE